MPMGFGQKAVHCVECGKNCTHTFRMGNDGPQCYTCWSKRYDEAEQSVMVEQDENEEGKEEQSDT